MAPTGVARVVASYASPAARPAGLGWDGSSLWLVSDADQTIYQVDPLFTTVQSTLPTPAATWSFGLDHDGVDLWGDVDSPELIYRLDDVTGAVLTSFASPYQSPNGVVADGAMLWHSAYSSDLALMDPTTGAVVRTIPAPGNQAPRGLEIYDGSLWVVDANSYPDDAIHRLDPADGTVLATYVPIGAPFGLMIGLASVGSGFFYLSDIDSGQVHLIQLEDNLLFYNGFESGDALLWSATGLDCGSTAPAPGGSCPSECTGGCPSAGTCLIDCSGTSACTGTAIICPPGFHCEVSCLGTDACRFARIYCPDDLGCSITCAGDQACQWMETECTWLGTCDIGCGVEPDACDGTLVTCGHNSCRASCAGTSAPTVECGGSCDCGPCS